MNEHSLIEISLSNLDDITTPSVIALFDRWGRGGAVVEQIAGEEGKSKVTTYLIPEDDHGLRQIEIGLELLYQARHTSPPGMPAPGHHLPQPHIRFLSETDWAEAWKTGYDVLHVGRQLVIKPTWRDYNPQPDDLTIELDPGMAFGSGLHPTTRLCLETLEDYLQPGTRVLDVGSGSGILSIAAARLGASHVLAVDIDPLAVRITRENVALNQAESIVDVEASWQASQPARQQGNEAEITTARPPIWDLVVANILAETIIELMPALAASLSTKSILIASGIIADRTQAVADALQENGLLLAEQRDDGEWVALVAGKDKAPNTDPWSLIPDP